MKNVISVCCLVIALGMVAAIADAKPLSRIIRNIGLSPEDLSMMSAAGASLYENTTPQAGRQVSWKNPETGSKGVARLTAVRGNCVHIQDIVYVAGDSRPLEIRTRLCQIADGSWLLQP